MNEFPVLNIVAIQSLFEYIGLFGTWPNDQRAISSDFQLVIFAWSNHIQLLDLCRGWMSNAVFPSQDKITNSILWYLSHGLRYARNQIKWCHFPVVKCCPVCGCLWRP